MKNKPRFKGPWRPSFFKPISSVFWQTGRDIGTYFHIPEPDCFCGSFRKGIRQSGPELGFFYCVALSLITGDLTNEKVRKNYHPSEPLRLHTPFHHLPTTGQNEKTDSLKKSAMIGNVSSTVHSSDNERAEKSSVTVYRNVSTGYTSWQMHA